MKKETIKQAVAPYMAELTKMADRIYDLAEPGLEEVRSSAILTDYLEKKGFQIERGIAGLPTAFRAVYEQGNGGPSFGFLAEYDALKGIGHACGHHMQGPSVIGAALALRDLCKDQPYKIVIYGTPAEETVGGKIIMKEKGCFQDIDLALMMHAAPNTCVDVRCMALEYSRMHYTVLDAGGPSNIVPGTAKAEYTLRSYSTDYLEKVIVPRFQDIIKGACLMTGTTCEIERSYPFQAKIPCLTLNDLIMENARKFEAPQLAGPREKTGSTDFGNVMYDVPGCCIRTAFVPEGTAAHSQEYLDAGKTERAHEAIRSGSEILAGTCIDMIERPELLEQIKEEFRKRKQEETAKI